MREIDRFHYSWNGPPGAHLREIEIEDDTPRDGLQGAFVRRPAVAEKIELLGIAASIGVQFAMLGFPSSSRQEFADCAALVAAIHTLSVSHPANVRSVTVDVTELDAVDEPSAEQVLAWAVKTFSPRIALASSFDAEDVVLIDKRCTWRSA